MKKNIAVITGGPAAEAGISLKSAEVVCQQLDKSKYNVFKVMIQGTDWIVERPNPVQLKIDRNDFSFMADGHKINFDCVFIAIHGTPAEDGQLQGYFDLLKIPYTTCGVLQAALTFNKMMCKQYLAPFGVKTAKAWLFKKQELSVRVGDIKTGYPVFVKPNKNGSSYGVTKVMKAEELNAALGKAFEFDDEVLVEEFLQGTEVSCGVMNIKGTVTALPITEIRSKNEFFDYKAKYEGHSNEITPAEIDPGLAKKIGDTSVFIYKQLGFKSICRIDYIIVGAEYYMLEVNSIPGLTIESIFPKQALAAGIKPEDFYGMLVEEALNVIQRD